MTGYYLKSMLQGARAAGPYLLIELFVPGGTLVALMLWLAQKRKAEPAGFQRAIARLLGRGATAKSAPRAPAK